MRSKTSFIKLGSLGLLLTLQQQDAAQAMKTGLKAQNSQQLASNLASLSGAYSQAFSESEIQNLLEAQVQSMQTQKTNIAHHKHHKKSKKHHKKEKKEEKRAPAAKSFVSTSAVDKTVGREQDVVVPIDEVKAISVHLKPNVGSDSVESVTLKSFRKIVGYDTFNSIMKESRDEEKDISDYYNVTVSMMIKRKPEAAGPIKPLLGEDGKPLAQSLDKGFPYDDGDTTIDNQTPRFAKGKNPTKGTIVSQLNGENVTKEALANLVQDTTAPVTVGLLQLDAEKSDSDNLSTLFSENVTRGALKNLVTDKPAPITVALAQKSDSDNLSTLFSENVTRGALKNLVTDKPAPITVALAQKGDGDILSALFSENVTRGALKNLVTDKPAPITVALAQKSDADNLSTLFSENVTRGALKNLVTDKPAPITVALA